VGGGSDNHLNGRQLLKEGKTKHRDRRLAGGCSMKLITMVTLAAALIGTPSTLQAQPQFIKDNTAKMIRKLGVHLNASVREPTDRDVSKGRTFGMSIGLSPGNTNGWRYPVGVTMFSENLHGPNGASFAVLRSTALMAGIGYGWHFGRLSTGASILGGFSVNRVRPEGDIRGAFDVEIGDVFVHVRNAFLVRPQLKAEYSLTRKLTLRVSGDYVLMHPDIAVETPAGSLSHQWDASNFHANVGIGVYPFHK
jgi:hypothetical protein